MFNLRPYQEQAIIDVRMALRRHRRVLLQSPCGSGKTVTGTAMARNALAKGLRVGWLNHRDYLIEQTSATFDAAGIFHSYIAAGRRFNPYAKAWIGSVGTVTNRLDKIAEPDVLITDEGHHSVARTWKRILDKWQRCKVIFLSATPWRLDGSGLDDVCEELILGPTVAWLIENGFLSQYRAFSFAQPDMSGVHARAGDYVTAEVEDIMDRRAIIGNMVDHYRKHADGLRALAFGVSIKHSMNIAAQFTASGIPSVHLDANSSIGERIAAAAQLASGAIKTISSCSLMDEGYDLSAQAGTDVTVEAIIDGAPTQSLGRHIQKNGRGLRPKPFPAILLDHAGNLLRHGLPDDEREWTLKPRQKGRLSAAPAIPVRQCPECFAVHAIHLKKCPGWLPDQNRVCGYEYPAVGREAEQVDGELTEIDVKAARKTRHMEEWRCRSVEEMISLGQRRGYQKPVEWAARVWTMHEAAGQRRVEDQARQLRMNV